MQARARAGACVKSPIAHDPSATEPGIPEFSLVRQGPLHDAARRSASPPRRLWPWPADRPSHPGHLGAARPVGVAEPPGLRRGSRRTVASAFRYSRSLSRGGAAPLAAEPFAEAIGCRIVSCFFTSGLVPKQARPAFTEVLGKTPPPADLAAGAGGHPILAFALGSSALGDQLLSLIKVLM